LETYGHWVSLKQMWEQAATDLRGSSQKPQLSVALHQLGMALGHLGEYAEAEKRYKESLTIERERSDRAGIAGTLHQLGILAETEAPTTKRSSCSSRA